MTNKNYQFNPKSGIKDLNDLFNVIVEEVQSGRCPSIEAMQSALKSYLIACNVSLITVFQQLRGPIASPEKAGIEPKPAQCVLAEILNGLIRELIIAELNRSHWPEEVKQQSSTLLAYTEQLIHGNQSATDPDLSQSTHIFNTHLLLYQFLCNPSTKHHNNMMSYARQLSGHGDWKTKWIGMASMAVGAIMCLLALHWYLPAILTGTGITFMGLSMLIGGPLSIYNGYAQFQEGEQGSCLSKQLTQTATCFWTAMSQPDDALITTQVNPSYQ